MQPNEANESLGSLSICIDDVDDVDSLHPGVQHVQQFPKNVGPDFYICLVILNSIIH